MRAPFRFSPEWIGWAEPEDFDPPVAPELVVWCDDEAPALLDAHGEPILHRFPFGFTKEHA